LYLKFGIHDEDIDLLSHLPNIVRINDIEESERSNAEDPKEVKLMLMNNPKIMQRPVLVDEGRAIIGRPPENILTLLHDNKS